MERGIGGIGGRFMASKEQILAAAKQRFQTKEVFFDDKKTISVKVRELSRPERDALNARLFVCGEDGKPVTVNSAGKQDSKGEEWKYQDEKFLIEEWLTATMEPTFTVEELQGTEWPESLKRSLYRDALSINGITVKEAAGN